jgi:hypothetical protein
MSKAEEDQAPHAEKGVDQDVSTERRKGHSADLRRASLASASAMSTKNGIGSRQDQTA